MGNTVVIGIRIPRWMKEELEKLGINYTREVKEFLLNRIREEKMKRLATDMDKIRMKTRKIKGNLTAEVIRESRDQNWNE